MGLTDARIAAARDDEIRGRDGWRCTAIIQPRVVHTRLREWRIPREPTRCPVMGSEMVVVDGKTYCPKHAREIAEGAEDGR